VILMSNWLLSHVMARCVGWLALSGLVLGFIYDFIFSTLLEPQLDDGDLLGLLGPLFDNIGFGLGEALRYSVTGLIFGLVLTVLIGRFFWPPRHLQLLLGLGLAIGLIVAWLLQAQFTWLFEAEQIDIDALGRPGPTVPPGSYIQRMLVPALLMALGSGLATVQVTGWLQTFEGTIEPAEEASGSDERSSFPSK
jgi:hypothetical protein